MGSNYLKLIIVKLVQSEMGKKTREEEEENYKDTGEKMIMIESCVAQSP